MTLAASVAVLAALLAPLSQAASAAHVTTVTVASRTDVAQTGTCNAFMVTTSGGGAPVGAKVDLEARSVEPGVGTARADSIAFCRPVVAGGFNEILATTADGDLGNGADGTIGGEGVTADDSTTPLIDGVVTFGLRSQDQGTYDIRLFVEEPAGDNGNDDREGDEPGASAVGIFTAEGGNTGSADRGAAATVDSLDCRPESSTRLVRTVFIFTCEATSSSGAGVADSLVSFDVVRGPNRQELGPTPCGATSLLGVATCSYIDPAGKRSRPGTDAILGYSEIRPLTAPIEPGAKRDLIHNTFLPAGPIHRTKSRMSFKPDFSGVVHSPVASCHDHRKVVIRKVRAGRDPIVRRVHTSNEGDYRAPEPKGKGIYWAFAKRKSFTTGTGVKVICLPDRAFAKT